MKFRRLGYPILLLLTALLAGGCSISRRQDSRITKSLPQAPAGKSTLENVPPYFEAGECRFDPPPGDVICGDLVVLENRDDPASPRVSLHVAIFPSFSDQPLPDPVIYLMGGGGGDSLAAAGFYLGAAGYRIRAERDFILYNQRGTKRNQPYLVCPGEEDLQAKLTGVVHTKTEADQLEYQFLLGCRDHLQEQGINLDFYDSVTHAADLADLIQVLGYDQANLYGTSYGTRLGLTMMRYHPDLVRSAILDSVLPPQIHFPSDAITSYLTALDSLFAACQSQSHCSLTYPALEDTFNQVAENLRLNPVRVDNFGESVSLDHILYLDAIYMMMHYSSELPGLPRAIRASGEGDFSYLDEGIYSVRTYSDFVATGVQYSSMCKDEVLFDSLERSRSLLEGQLEFWQEYFNLSFYYQICEDWIQERAQEIEDTPVTSSIPALVLAGRFDPITAPAWSRETADFLAQSYFYEFPNMGHGVLRYDPCGLELGLAFLADPYTEPDASCLEDIQIPTFY